MKILKRMLRENILYVFEKIKFFVIIVAYHYHYIFNIPWTLKERNSSMIINWFNLVQSLGDLNGLSTYSTLLSQNIPTRKGTFRNGDGTLCKSGKIYFSQKYTVLPKILVWFL